MIDKTEHNIPNKPGYYWAKEQSFKWWNLIVNIYGEEPHLKWRAWKLDRLKEGIIQGTGKPDFIFGSEINELED